MIGYKELKRLYGEWQIAGRTWRLVYRRIIDGENQGMTLFPERLVLIEYGLSKEELVSTFCHEFLHCIEMEYNIKISHDYIYKAEGYLALLMTTAFNSKK